MQELLETVEYLASELTEPIGIQIDPDTFATSPTCQRIDINGDNVNPFPSFFNKHVLFGGISLVARNRAGGTIIRDGFVYDGSTGFDLLVEYPTERVLFRMDGDFPQYIIMPANTPSTEYKLSPMVFQRGGVERTKIYIGAKEAYGYLDPADSKFKLGSASGKQPITGAVGYPDLPNSGRLTLDDAELYANNIGTGFGICNPYTYASIKLRMLIEYGTFDIPSKIGLGISNLPAGATGVFGGKLTGSDGIDNTLAATTNGTGTGTGVNGETPIAWRYLENIYNNVFEFEAGLNMFYNSGTDAEGQPYTAGSFRVLRGDGLGIPAATLAYGDYLKGSTAVPLGLDNYISAFQTNETGAKLFIPFAVNGLSNAGACDGFYYPRYDPSIVAHGGYWANTTSGGPWCTFANCPTTYSHRMAGCRIEYYPPVV